MSISTILSLVLGALQFINWLTKTMDEKRLREAAQSELIAQQMGELRARFARLDAIISDVQNLTPEDKRKILKED